MYMMGQKRCPSLTLTLWRQTPARLTHIRLHRTFADFDAQLEQLVPNTRQALQSVLNGHLFDQGNCPQ